MLRAHSLKRSVALLQHITIPLHSQRCLSMTNRSSLTSTAHLQRRRCLQTSTRVQDQYLQGYKDIDRYHGKYPKRTHMCGDLRPGDKDKKVVLCGWAQPSRSLSQDLVFLPIRDASGTTQLVYHAEHCSQEIKTTIQKLATESVVCVEGIVHERPEGTINQQSPTGGIEVEIQHIYCLNPASPQLPFWPSQPQLPNEEVRLKYRYLDLRRPALQNNLRLRSMTANTVRQYLIDEHGFTEIETPTLFKSTPEGAREFVVPTRKPGQFYALPQSPQQHKQMLMAAGFDRYFQIARCFRDEDLRADRQPEFTQIDLEMSFVSAQQVQQVIEGMVSAIWSKALGARLTKDSFPHMTYSDAMSKYGSDKPDLRFDMQIQDISRCLKKDNQDQALDCLVIKQGASQMTGGDLKVLLKDLELTDSEKQNFGFIKINENNIHQWPLKCGGGLKQAMDTLSTDKQQSVNTAMNVEQGDLVFLHQRPKYLYGGNTVMGRTRLQLANHLQRKGHLTLDDTFKFVWIESFPLFTPDEQGIRTWQATHHPFTAPFDEDIPLLGTNPEQVRGQHYDLVLNGMEIGGGSIRIHSPVMQTFIFDKVLQLEKHEYERFDHLIDALGGGCPPHGGIALGFDRLMAILCNSTSIRDVIAFPKAAGGKDFVVNSPSEVTPSQLKEYGLKVVVE